MKILMVLSDNTYPPDIRVGKEANSLIKNGHSIHLICRNEGNQKIQENVSGVNVNRINMRQEFLIDHVTLFILLVRQILKVARKNNVDILHVHDVPMAPSTILAGKVLGKKIVLDLHENYPAMIGYAGPVKKKSFGIRMVVKVLEMMERFSCRMADHIIVVEKEAKDRLQEEMGIPENKITIVSNHADITKLDEVGNEDIHLKQPNIVYSGGLSLHRGMDTVLEALEIVNQDREVYLYIIGGKEREIQVLGLDKQMKELKLEDKIEMTGWISFSDSISYVKKSDVCIIPHHSNPHTESTIPHKIFQFMYLRKPILVSDVGPLKRVVDGTNSGLVFKAGDAIDLAQKINKILNSKEQWEAMGDNGRKAVQERYNWNMESRKLISLYDNLEKQQKS